MNLEWWHGRLAREFTQDARATFTESVPLRYIPRARLFNFPSGDGDLIVIPALGNSDATPHNFAIPNH